MKALGKAGYTLIEAIVVLAVTSLTVSVLFSIGARGGQTVLRLGNRALEVADSQVGRDTYRSVVGDLIVPPLTTRAQAEGGLEMDEDDYSLTGDATTLSSRWLGQRTGACGGKGDSGRMTLSLSQLNGHTILSCQLEDGDPVTLLDLGVRDIHFQYSEDGSTWTDAWSVLPGQPVQDSADPSAEERRVYVRLGAEDGKGELVALTTSGRALRQGIPY